MKLLRKEEKEPELSEQEIIINKILEKKEQLKNKEKSYEERILKKPVDAAIVSAGATFFGMFTTEVIAYDKFLHFPGKREDIIREFFEKYPEAIELAQKVVKIRDFDAMVDFLNGNHVSLQRMWTSIGLTDYFNNLFMFTIAQSILVGTACASTPFLYYYAKKHFHKKSLQKIEKEIQKLEQQKVKTTKNALTKNNEPKEFKR